MFDFFVTTLFILSGWQNPVLAWQTGPFLESHLRRQLQSGRKSSTSTGRAQSSSGRTRRSPWTSSSSSGTWSTATGCGGGALELSFIFLLSLSGPGRQGLKVIGSLILIMMATNWVPFLVNVLSLVESWHPHWRRGFLLLAVFLAFKGC